MADKRNVYQDITDVFLNALNEGKIPWNRPWDGNGTTLPYNYATGRHYNGINAFLLWMDGGDGYMTFKQIQDKGYRLNKGSKHRFVVYWNWKDYPVKDDNGNPVMKDDGTPETKKHAFLKEYYVYSIRDIKDKDGNPIKTAPPARHNDPIAIGEKIINNYLTKQPTLKFFNDEPSSRAFYRPSTDSVTVPMLDQFKDKNEYYSTAFHELTHSTGHESRLNRLTNDHFGDHNYSKEELVAEMGSAMLCALSGIGTEKTLKNSKAYIQGWISALKNDPKMIVWASGKAQKAVQMIADGMIDEDGLLIAEEEPTTEATTEEPKAEPVEMPVLPEPVNTWSYDNGILTIINGNAKGSFKVAGLLNLTVAELKKFKKEWINDKDTALLKVFTDELAKNGNRYESANKKKVMFTGAKPKNTELAKIVKYLAKQNQVHFRITNGKYYITDSYMGIETDPKSIEELADTIPLLKQIKDAGMMDNAKASKDGRRYELSPNSAHIDSIFKSIDWNAETEIDFTNCIDTGTKAYTVGETSASVKMINLFKDKIFRQAKKFSPLTKITDEYRVLVCPMRVA